MTLQRHIETALSAVICALLLVWLSSCAVAKAQIMDEEMGWMLDAVTRPVASGEVAVTNIPQYSNSIWWLRFNENTMTNDSSFAATNAAVNPGGAASPAWVSGSEGCYFDGGDYLNSANFFYAINGNTSVTYSVWVKMSNAVNYAGIINSRNVTFNGLIQDATSANVSWYIAKPTSASGSITNVLVAGEWHHIVATYNTAGTGLMTVYRDGIQQAETAIGGTYIDLRANYYVGWDTVAGGRNFKGLMDDVLIYKCSLTSNEVFQLYQLGH